MGGEAPAATGDGGRHGDADQRRPQRPDAAVVGRHGDDQSCVADVQRADAMADCDRTDAVTLLRDLGCHLRDRLLRGRVRRVLESRDGAATVGVADHANEADDGAGRPVEDQSLVFGQIDRLLGENSPDDARAHLSWSPPPS